MKLLKMSEARRNITMIESHSSCALMDIEKSVNMVGKHVEARKGIAQSMRHTLSESHFSLLKSVFDWHGEEIKKILYLTPSKE